MDGLPNSERRCAQQAEVSQRLKALRRLYLCVEYTVQTRSN